jgi:uncharacterized protein (TIRG00374 family)
MTASERPDFFRQPARLAWKGLLAAVAGFLLWKTFAPVDPDRLARILAQSGPLIPVFLLPFLAVSLLDSAGWCLVLGIPATSPRSLRILAATLGIEAMARSLPGGPATADGLSPLLLRRAGGVSTAVAFSGTAARKFLLVATQSAFLALALLVGPRGGSTLSTILWTTAAALAMVAVVMAVVLSRCRPAERVLSLGRILAWRPFHRFLDRHTASFRNVDRSLRETFSERHDDLGLAAILYLGVWIGEAAEGWLFLRLLGVPATLQDMLFVEAAISSLRIATPFIPGGIGPVDLGYARLLTGLGLVPDAGVAAAFVVLHRLREVLWTAVGYGILPWAGGRDEVRSAGEEGAGARPLL